MEEVSSVDSFPADTGDSVQKGDAETKKVDDASTIDAEEQSPTTKDADSGATRGGGGGDNAEDDATNNDEEFEQISDGTFEVDDNSQNTLASRPTPVVDEGGGGGGEGEDVEEDDCDKEEPKTNTDKDSEIAENTKSQESTENNQSSGKTDQEKTDFEEVDANSGNTNTNDGADESDMLGDSDYTLPSKPAEGLDDNASTSVEKENEQMDVDEDNAESKAAESSIADIEMNDSLTADGEKDKADEEGAAEEGAAEEPANVDEETSVNESASNHGDEAEQTEERDADKDRDDEMEGEGEGEGEAEGETETDKAKDVAEEDQNIAEQEEEEHGDETVENVQEPEESDVCLVPDDTENQLTEAEKEQAILARENAEKEDEDEEKEKSTEEESTQKDDETVAESAEERPNTPKDAPAEDNAQAIVAGAKSTAIVKSPEEASTADETAANEGNEAEETLLEELQETTNADGTTVQKIIIAWIVSLPKTCKQCGEEKTCSFRYKNPENGDHVYLCELKCCEALLQANPGKYFIRRKKFLVEEVSSEDTNKKDDSTVSAEGDADSAADESQPKSPGKNEQKCMQCSEKKVCKYFFKQDEENYYICNDDCYNLLNAEEPDKFKLKRHSIRVRNIGATTISSSNSSNKKSNSAESRVVARTATEAEAARLERVASFTRRCADCFSEITLGDKNLVWETMDFCNEQCLGKYQRTIGSKCQTCNGDVSHQALGKYCVRFGFDIRQFCCAVCLNEYKKGLKTCSCCQKDISGANEGFLAPVGDKEQFKDFCSQGCMRRYDNMCNPKKKLRNDVCAVCNNDKPVRVEIVLDAREHNFCSNPCFSAFKFVSNIVADQCGMCTKYFERKGAESFTIYTEQRRAKVFCSRICMNVFIIVNRRIVSCQWCKVKKYNFDMIYKQQDSQDILMCSLNCLTLYGVSINAFSRTLVKCDNCSATSTPQYHLTMSDASMRNFCTYQCVMQFQSQFARTPLTLENEAAGNATHPSQSTSPSAGAGTLNIGASTGKNSGAPFPTGLPKRVKLKASQMAAGNLKKGSTIQIKFPVNKKNVGTHNTTLPVISTVSSLASGETETMIGNVTVRRSRVRGARRGDSPPPLSPINGAQGANARARPRKDLDVSQSLPSTSASSKRSSLSETPPPLVTTKVQVQTDTKIVTVPPYPPAVRNVMTHCKPQTVEVGFQIEPQKTNRAIQTDKDYSNKVLVPVPVPIFIPQPMYMYSAPFPVPVPIPLPIPVPIFIPTTRNSAQGILKEIKKIQDKMPADPFEAELLMMAEMVAEDKHVSDSDSDVEDIKPEPAIMQMQYNNTMPHTEEVVANNSYGEDVLQMALKMATGDYDQPTVDLESAMATNTITNPPPTMVDDSLSHMQMQQQQMMEVPQRPGRGRKRGSLASPVSPRNGRSPVKRQRLTDLDQTPTSQTPSSLEKPDANMCLKYTFGVNAWKQWVMTKNADIEKTSVRKRPFKTELLQMTADELNYSLCLFVKEVRKPNGTEYAPDTIYYLVLGIQQYLYENGRIDNIFTDPYYERFTDCLDEVARRFSVLYNDSQYIVTRVEEEHLWECKQLGAHSPHVLLSTLMFFNTKHFNLTTVEEHMQLSFSHIMKHWKRSAQNAKQPGSRNVLLRFYPPQSGLDSNPRKKKVYEQQENEENPLRCPVRLYEFYLSKCPESVKTRNDVFYLQPERSCVPDSPVWYSTQALSQEALQKMLHRVKMVKEINIALLTS